MRTTGAFANNIFVVDDGVLIRNPEGGRGTSYLLAPLPDASRFLGEFGRGQNISLDA
jgi:hypothetical protein